MECRTGDRIGHPTMVFRYRRAGIERVFANAIWPKFNNPSIDELSEAGQGDPLKSCTHHTETGGLMWTKSRCEIRSRISRGTEAGAVFAARQASEYSSSRSAGGTNRHWSPSLCFPSPVTLERDRARQPQSASQSPNPSASANRRQRGNETPIQRYGRPVALIVGLIEHRNLWRESNGCPPKSPWPPRRYKAPLVAASRLSRQVRAPRLISCLAKLAARALPQSYSRTQIQEEHHKDQYQRAAPRLLMPHAVR